MCNSIAAFETNSLHDTNAQIKLGDHSQVLVTQAGTVVIKNIKQKVLFVPRFRISLLSVSQLDKAGWSTSFLDGTCTIQNTHHRSTLTASLANNLYRFEISDSQALVTTRSMAKNNIQIEPNDEKQPMVTIQHDSTNGSNRTRSRASHPIHDSNPSGMWHRRLGHLHHESLKRLGLQNGSPEESQRQICDVCIRAKHRQHFERTRVTRSTIPFELIHSDLAGPFKPSIGGATYYLLYIDDCTRYTEVYLLQTKSAAEIVPKFEHYKAWVQNQGFSIKRF